MNIVVEWRLRAISVGLPGFAHGPSVPEAARAGALMEEDVDG
jgi:hypothetical protein